MKVNEFFNKVILINLDRRTDRLKDVTEELNNLEITYKRISAVDAVELGITPKDACRVSHIKALEMAEGNTLILEDDATFMPNFLENFTKFTENLPKYWDIIYLGAHIGTSEPVNSYMARGLITSSAHAYCINPKRITEMLNMARNTTDHIDVAYAKEHPRMKAYVAQPTLVKQKPSFSDLLLKDVDYLSWYK
jgi:GR25 family glycosyltransferase involved in LPS biosynthesis